MPHLRASKMPQCPPVVLVSPSLPHAPQLPQYSTQLTPFLPPATWAIFDGYQFPLGSLSVLLMSPQLSGTKAALESTSVP